MYIVKPVLATTCIKQVTCLKQAVNHNFKSNELKCTWFKQAPALSSVDYHFKLFLNADTTVCLRELHLKFSWAESINLCIARYCVNTLK